LQTEPPRCIPTTAKGGRDGPYYNAPGHMSWSSAVWFTASVSLVVVAVNASRRDRVDDCPDPGTSDGWRLFDAIVILLITVGTIAAVLVRHPRVVLGVVILVALGGDAIGWW
jgi:hypothetical protein